MARIFISYMRVDKEKVFNLKDQIESAIGEKCWIDLDGIESRRQFRSVICHAIDNAQIVLFMYSKAHLNIDFENDWTIKELDYAQAKKKIVVLVNIDNAPLDNLFLFDFGLKNNIYSSDKTHFQKLLRDLKVWLDVSSDLVAPQKPSFDDFATTYRPNSSFSYHDDGKQNKNSETYFPYGNNNQSGIQKEGNECASPALQSSKGLFGKIKDLFFGKSDNRTSTEVNDRVPLAEKVNSSIFAPSEAKRGDFMMVQVFLYKDDEKRAVARKASEVDPDASRRNFTPLSVKLKDGDRVKARLKMSSKDIEVNDPVQEMIWQGHYTDCQFCVFVPEAYKPSSLMGTVILTVNDIPCGRMMFKTKIVSRPQQLYAKIDCKTFHKIFISYSHKDERRVKYIAEAYRAQGVDYFFDRHYLKGGDVYPVKIREYIDSADLFILCWSKNAAESDYVTLERRQALALAYPQVDMEKASINIHPISIEPHADYPEDMNEVYHFEEV